MYGLGFSWLFMHFLVIIKYVTIQVVLLIKTMLINMLINIKNIMMEFYTYLIISVNHVILINLLDQNIVEYVISVFPVLIIIVFGLDNV